MARLPKTLRECTTEEEKELLRAKNRARGLKYNKYQPSTKKKYTKAKYQWAYIVHGKTKSMQTTPSASHVGLRSKALRLIETMLEEGEIDETKSAKLIEDLGTQLLLIEHKYFFGQPREIT